MTEGRPVTIEIVAIQGRGVCPEGMAVGRRWEVDSAVVPEGMCGWAYHAIFPFLAALRFGGSFPWEKEGVAEVVCPDPANPVVFRLTVR